MPAVLSPKARRVRDMAPAEPPGDRSDRDTTVNRQHHTRDVARLIREAKKPTAAAISEGSAKRPIGIAAASSAFLSSGIDDTIRVSALGEMALTVTPKRASSLAAVLVKPMMPALAVA